MCKLTKWLVIGIMACFSVSQAGATEKSFTVGVLHPNGANLLGYSVETRIRDKLYWHYAFGLPTGAAIGVNYYQTHDENGITGAVGTSLGSYIYASIAYQVSLGNRSFLKFGAGFSNGFSYDAAEIPVISYEHRF